MTTPIVEGVNTSGTGDETQNLSGNEPEDALVLLVLQVSSLRLKR